ncbi:MAG: nucleotidyltransferase domain-containing protein [Candidatus Omnitrophota bacterium]
MKPKINIDTHIIKKHKVMLAYLFGSRAKGNAANYSDFDIAVLFFEESNTVADFFDKTVYLKEDLRDYFPNEVDLVALNSANSLLKYEVIANAQLIYVKNAYAQRVFDTTFTIRAGFWV